MSLTEEARAFHDDDEWPDEAEILRKEEDRQRKMREEYEAWQKECDEKRAKTRDLERRFTEYFGYEPHFYGTDVEYEKRLRESIETGKARIGEVPKGAIL